MKIERTRYVLMRKHRTEIWAGRKDPSFVSLEKLGTRPVRKYQSAKAALMACTSWCCDYEAVEVTETVEIAAETMEIMEE